MFVCLFGFFVQLENFLLIWRRHHYRWRAANLTYARNSWSLSSEGSQACHTNCVKGHPFIMVISEGPWHSGANALTHCAPAAMYRQYKQYFTSRMNMYSLYTVWSFKTISNSHFLESSFKIDLPPRSPGDQRSQTYCFGPVCHFVICHSIKRKFR